MAGPELLDPRGPKAITNGSARTDRQCSAEAAHCAYPVRTCLGCGARSNKAELVRLVVSAGVLVADRMKILPGRGVYCCRSEKCYQRLVKQQKKLAWALRYQATGKVGNLAISQGLDVEFA